METGNCKNTNSCSHNTPFAAVREKHNSGPEFRNPEMGLGDSRTTKDLLIALVGRSCVLSTHDACDASQRCLYAFDDGMLRMYTILRAVDCVEKYEERVKNYVRDLRFKHLGAKTIIVSFDAPDNVPSSKSMEHKVRDEGGFSDEELAAFKGNHYFSGITPLVQSTVLADQHAKDKARVSKTLKKGKRVPAYFRTPFKWYVERILKTRRFKPDVKMAFIIKFLQEYEDTDSPETRRRDSAGRGMNQRIVIDGAPWPFKFSDVLNWHQDEDITVAWDYADTEYVSSPVDGSEYCPEGRPVGIVPAVIKDHYHGSMVEQNTSSCTLSIGAEGCYWLPPAWAWGVGEADTTIAGGVRRCVVQDIRARGFPPASQIPTGTLDDRDPLLDVREEENIRLPSIWVTACDTDMIIILLLLLDELYQGDPSTIDFRLYLDLTYSSAPYQPYYNLPGFASITAQDRRMDPLVRGYSTQRPLGCAEVWDMTAVWMELKTVLSGLHGSRFDRSVQSFSTMVCMGGTDFVSPLGKVTIVQTSRAYFAGGYLMLEKALRKKEVDATQTRNISDERSDNALASCSTFACDGMVHIGHWPTYISWGFNEDYMLDFVHMVLTQHLRYSKRSVPVDDRVSTEYKAEEFKYASLLEDVIKTAKNERSASGKLLTTLGNLRYPKRGMSDKRVSVTEKDVERAIAALNFARSANASACKDLRTGIHHLARLSLPVGLLANIDNGTKRRHIRGMHLKGDELVALYSKKRRADALDRPLNGSKGTSTRYVKRPNKNSPKELFARQRITHESIDVFVRVIHHQLYYWTTGTRKHYVANATAFSESRRSITGFYAKEDGSTDYAEVVCRAHEVAS